MTDFFPRMFPEIFILVSIIGGITNLDFIPKFSENPGLQVEISTGVIQGRKALTHEKFLTYYLYQGIPYAQPPVDDLRFRPPQPPKSWDGILDATKEGSKCMQFLGQLQDIINSGSEDCLFLNVYTPHNPRDLTNAKPLPVMVWIYGGGFLGGGSDFSIYGPDYLLEHQVVVVTFNYRLGVFGFLSTGDLESPGNYGLKDQVAALEWIQRNIAHFGGDPNKVTVFGQSAGGASVQYLLQSPLTKGLIHRAISESGSTLCPWSYQRNPRRVAYQIGLVSGIIARNTSELIDGLRKADISALKWTQSGATLLNLINPLNGLPFSPTIEPEHPGAFLTEKSHEALKNGNFKRIPYITGVNSQEGAMFDLILDISRPILGQLDVAPQILVPDDMNLPTFSPKRFEVGLKIREYYFKLKPIGVVYKSELLNYISDAEFLRGILESARLVSQYTKTYFYHFSYEGFLGVRGNENIIQTRRKGVAHSEDLWYIWRKENLTSESEMDNVVRKQMLKLWTNFAWTGNPTPTYDPLLRNKIWPPMTSTEMVYLDINSNLTLRSDLRKEAMDFWHDLYEEYGKPPFDTY